MAKDSRILTNARFSSRWTNSPCHCKK
ncbi:unnamed protein product, partial [Allacma fusca]